MSSFIKILSIFIMIGVGSIFYIKQNTSSNKTQTKNKISHIASIKQQSKKTSNYKDIFKDQAAQSELDKFNDINDIVKLDKEAQQIIAESDNFTNKHNLKLPLTKIDEEKELQIKFQLHDLEAMQKELKELSL